MSSVTFNKMFAAFATAEKEGRFSFWLDSFFFGVSPGLAYGEELEAPPTLHKGSRGSLGEELALVGVRRGKRRGN